MLAFFEHDSILHDEQNGFRSKRSCTDHIFTLSSIVKNKLQSGQEIFACYVDFRKAFDLVPRELLLYRLLEYGVDGHLYNAIKSIYSNASCSVRINGVMSEWFESNQGVKQGDNLSPNLFSIYLNPLIAEMKASGIGVNIDNDTICILAYADDLVLLAENEGDLQRLLDILKEWCYKWRLSVNADKTKVMHFRQKNRNRSSRVFKVDEACLETVSQYKYLGVILDEHMDFAKTAELLANSAGRALGSVINKVKLNKDLGFNTYTTLIDSCVMPIILYASGVWGLKSHKICEDVLLRACRFYSGVHRLAPIPGIQGDFGWWDCKSRCNLELIRLYNRFITMDPDRLNRRVFMYDKEVCKENWNERFKQILVELELDRYWLNNAVIPIEVAKEKIAKCFENDWKHHCSTKPKLRTYVTFKQDTKVAAHITCNLSKYERSLISQLRLGILPIRIETGRYTNTDVAERICLLCEEDKVENEVHFLFECSLYDAERNQFETSMNCNFQIMSTDDKFKMVFDHPYSLGRFMRLAMSKRTEKLYHIGNE